MDHLEDFYRPQLESLGYSLHETYRRNKDAVIVGFKKKQFQILDKEVVDYNDLEKLYKEFAKRGAERKGVGVALDSRDFAQHNKAIICLLRHVSSNLVLLCLGGNWVAADCSQLTSLLGS